MLDFATIRDLFNGKISGGTDDRLNEVIRANYTANSELWKLEDLARMRDRGDEHVSAMKKAIDEQNQIRNNFIREMDIEITHALDVTSLHDPARLYGESPGMIIDRLAILSIKLAFMRRLISLMQEADLVEEFKAKKAIVEKQIETLGGFLDRYLTRLAAKEVYFEIQQPVKLYNDERVKKYVRQLNESS